MGLDVLVSLALGVFDLFTYTASGAVYVALLAFIADQLGLDVTGLASANTTLVLVAALLASYLLGHATYRLGTLLDILARRPVADWTGSQRRFSARTATARAARLITLDPVILLAAAEVHAKDAALEISRLRAVGLMLRNVVPALAVATVTAIVEGATGHRPGLAAATAVLLASAAIGLYLQGVRLREWAVTKTYELAYWLPEVTDHLASLPEASPPDPAGGPTTAT